mmetsp:Transcript_8082/g.22761  ORF Transcript_8082/g.22761 Transcript_8082/m.22761 type:complete len:102 (-) Transcript_8082:901-1206(-)
MIINHPSKDAALCISDAVSDCMCVGASSDLFIQHVTKATWLGYYKVNLQDSVLCEAINNALTLGLAIYRNDLVSGEDSPVRIPDIPICNGAFPILSTFDLH